MDHIEGVGVILACRADVAVHYYHSVSENLFMFIVLMHDGGRFAAQAIITTAHSHSSSKLMLAHWK